MQAMWNTCPVVDNFAVGELSRNADVVNRFRRCLQDGTVFDLKGAPLSADLIRYALLGKVVDEQREPGTCQDG